MQKILCLFIGLLVFFSVNAFANNLEKEKAAVISAQEWLGLIDAGKYTESWKEAAEYFRNAIGQEQWEKSLPAVRKPLGKLVKRKVKAKTFQTSLPGCPGWGVCGHSIRNFIRKQKSSHRNHYVDEGKRRPVESRGLLYQIRNGSPAIDEMNKTPAVCISKEIFRGERELPLHTKCIKCKDSILSDFNLPRHRGQFLGPGPRGHSKA